MFMVDFCAKYVNSFGKNSIFGRIVKKDFRSNKFGDKIYLMKSLPISNITSIQDAKLLIVEWGGILTHSLIVCRELEIPIIFGTKSFNGLEQGQKIEINFEKKTFTVE